MKAFFLRRALREKVLLLVFAALAWFIWAARGLERGRTLWGDWRSARAELAAQQLWLQTSAAVADRAAAATRALDPAKTLNATRLVGELNALASQAGLTADISAQRTDHADQFAFHTVQVTFRRAELPALLKFYRGLAKRSPYIGLEQFSLVTDRANARQLNASFRIGSPELSR